MKRPTTSPAYLAALAAAALPLGCAPAEPTGPVETVTTVRSNTVTGTISGTVQNALTGAPETGVTATLLPAGETEAVQSADDGSYTIDKAPVGSNLTVQLSKPGFTRGVATARIIPNAGDFPINNGAASAPQVALFPLVQSAADGYVAQVHLERDGEPVTDATVTATLGAAYTLNNRLAGKTTVQATLEGGAYNLVGLPDLAVMASVWPTAQLTLSVVPATGAPYVTTRSLSVLMTDDGNTFDLPEEDEPNAQALRLEDSNVGDFDSPRPQFPSMLAPSTPVTFTFNQAIDPVSFFAEVTDASGAIIPATPSVNGSTAQVQLTGPTSPGQPYFVHYTARPLDERRASDGFTSQDGMFFAQTPQGPVQLALDGWAVNEGGDDCIGAGDTLYFFVNQPLGGRNGSGNAYTQPVREFLPVRITSSSPALQMDSRLLADSEDPIVLAHFEDDLAGPDVDRGPHYAPGFTRAFSFRLPEDLAQDPAFPIVNNGAINLDIALELNTRDLPAAEPTGTKLLRSVSGAVANRAVSSATVRFAIEAGTNLCDPSL